ncbi:MAG: hypothetical protein JSW55_07290, partial [Chloroflexota bacterium]
MGYQDDLDDTWAEFEPVQSEDRPRWPLFLAGGAALFMLLCICLIGSYFVYQEFLATPPTPTLPAIPTSAVSGGPGTETGSQGGPVASPEGESGAESSPTPAIAPTVTMQPSPAVGTQAPTEAPQDGSTVQALRQESAPVLDGSLAEWSSVPAWSSTYLVFQDPSWNGSDDLLATWRLAWDSANLYIGVEVIDDIHVQTQGG